MGCLNRSIFSLSWRLAALGAAVLVACSDAAAPEGLDTRPQQLCTSGDPPPPTSPCPSSGPCRILRLGNSLTVGCKVQGSCEAAGVPGSYQNTLWPALVGANKWVDFVGQYSNGPFSLGDREYLAVPGYRLDQLLTLANQPVRQLKPRIIILEGGFNDLAQGATLADMQTRWTNLTFDLHAGGAVDGRYPSIVWIGLHPYGTDPTKDCQAKAFNEWVRGRIGTAGIDRFVDMRSGVDAIVYPDDYAPNDGAHLNAGGYAKMGRKVFEALTDPARPLLP
jgi:lysophospholipase L1-like esterase